MAPRPVEQILTVSVARQYYVEDRSKSEIAEDLGISRFRVARLLDVARRSGMVEIHVHSPETFDSDLSERVRREYGLRHAIVLNVPEDDVRLLRQRLGNTTAEVLQDLVGPDDVLGIAWTRSVVGASEVVTKFPPCPVVQLTGALSSPEGRDVLEVVRGFARAGGGTPSVFYAPLIAHDAATARTLRRQPDVARAMSLIPSVTVAAVGIGAWQSDLSSIYDAIDEESRDKASKAGVTSEISGIFLDADGKAVSTPLSRRVIGVTSDELAAIRTVVAITYGKKKAAAVGSVLRGGWVHVIVTHAGLAEQLLSGRS